MVSALSDRIGTVAANAVGLDAGGRWLSQLWLRWKVAELGAFARRSSFRLRNVQCGSALAGQNNTP